MIFLCWLGVHARAWARVTFPKKTEWFYAESGKGTPQRQDYAAIQIGTCARCGHSHVRRWSLA